MKYLENYSKAQTHLKLLAKEIATLNQDLKISSLSSLEKISIDRNLNNLKYQCTLLSQLMSGILKEIIDSPTQKVLQITRNVFDLDLHNQDVIVFDESEEDIVKKLQEEKCAVNIL